jgi:hypothetical protein
MKSKIIIISCLVVGLTIATTISIYLGPIIISRGNSIFDDNLAAAGLSKKQRQKQTHTQPPPSTNTIFTENFDSTYSLKETGSMDKSNNPNWWLSSGGYFYSANGVGNTILGPLSAIDPWRVAYSLSNSLDTDNGYYPQNIFRLVLRSQWQNFTQEAYFKIDKDNLSANPNRNASNGLLFFNRYQDAFNLYYTGIRVDGYAVIKKKINGAYYTMAYKPFINGPAWDKDNNPDLLPKNIWIGLRSVVQNNTDGTISIKLYVDNDRTGNWVLVAEAKDDGKSYGGSVFSSAGYAGIRTDFMDVEFNGYSIKEN